MIPTTFDYFTSGPVIRAGLNRTFGIRSHRGTPRGTAGDGLSRRAYDELAWRFQPHRRYSMGLPTTPTHRARTHRAEYVAIEDGRRASDRAVLVLAAMRAGTPKPIFGKRRADVTA